MMLKWLFLLVLWRTAVFQDLVDPSGTAMNEASDINDTSGILPMSQPSESAGPVASLEQVNVAGMEALDNSSTSQPSESAGPMVSLEQVDAAAVLLPEATLTPLPALSCTGGGCNCCTRLFNDNIQAQLDWLDQANDGQTCLPRARDRKINVFVLSSGLNQNHPAFLNTTINPLLDCKNESTTPTSSSWTVNVDLQGTGTRIAGLIAGGPYGFTLNAIINSVKITDNSNSRDTLAFGCGLRKVQTFLAANPTEMAIVVVGISITSSSNDYRTILSTLNNQSRAIVVLTSAATSPCFTFTSGVPRVINPGNAENDLKQKDGNDCTNVYAATENVIVPALNSNADNNLAGNVFERRYLKPRMQQVTGSHLLRPFHTWNGIRLLANYGSTLLQQYCIGNSI